MPIPELTHLRATMGSDWIEANILSQDAKHLLGRWYRKGDEAPWVLYTDQLLGDLIKSDRLSFDRDALARKLESEYVPTLCEIELAVFLLSQGFAVVMEPMAPKKGPDLRADYGKQSYFLEVRAVGDSENDDRFNEVSSAIFARLNETPSRFTVKITVGEACIAGSGALNKAIDTIIDAIPILNEKKWKHACLYHSSQGSLLDPGTTLNAKEQELANNSDIIAEFTDSGKHRQLTPATTWRPFKSPPEPDQTHERLKKILAKKKTQLPDKSRGILVFDVSKLFMLSDFSIESALYGNLIVNLTAPSAAGEPIEEPTFSRNTRGFFGKSSRVSAVIFHNRTVHAGKVHNRWRVFPTNRANADTIHLDQSELQRFGDLEDRLHLSADNVSDFISP